MDLAGWDGFLKGLGGAGLFIVFLVIENARLRRDRTTALANERAAGAALIAAKDAHAKELLEQAAKNTELVAEQIGAANATANGLNGVAASVSTMAGELREAVDRIPERRRAPA